jgi:tetratricopeptide (TPR) repeat protein
LQNDFVSWDDGPTLLENPNYRGLDGQRLRWMFTSFYLGHYQPLSWVTFALDYLIWGVDPFGYHLTNLLLHACNAVLFYYLSARLLSLAFRDGTDPLSIRVAAVFSAVLFAIHPLRVESVAWATERRDVLSGLFFLVTILSYLRAFGEGQRNYARWLSVALLAYALSLLSKATGITLPLVLLLLDIYPLGRLRGSPFKWSAADCRKVCLEKLPFFFLALAFGGVALLAQREAGALRTVERYDLLYRGAQAFFGIVFYLWKTALPVKLSPLYEAPFYVDLRGPVFMISVAIVMALSLVFVRARDSWPGGLASWVYYLVLLAPVLGIAQSGPQLVADRYSYLACLSWAVLAGAGLLYGCGAWIKDGITKKFVYAALGVTVIFSAALAGLTRRQIQVWHDSETLWRQVLSVTPESSYAQNNLGNVFAKRGDVDEAVQRFQIALRLNPRLAEAHYNLGNILYRRGQLDQAVGYYRDAIRVRPAYAEAHYNLAVALAKNGHLDEAIQHYRIVIQLRPNDAAAHNNLGNVLYARGEVDEAIAQYREALRIQPAFTAAKENLDQLKALPLSGSQGAVGKPTDLDPSGSR